MDTTLFQDNLVKSDRIVYTPSVFAKTNLIHLQEAGSLQSLQPHTCKRGQLSSYLFFIVTSGSGQVQYGEDTFSLSSGSCVFLDCHNTYAHRSSLELWNLKWVHFYGPNMSAIYSKYLQRGGIPCFVSKNPEKYIGLLQEIYEIAASDHSVRDMKIFEKLTALLTFLMEEDALHDSTGKNLERTKKNLQPLKEYLDQNYMKKISLDELSEQFFINKYYLTRLFKKEYGLSINHYIIEVRITHAKKLLRFTNDSVEKIGQQCGIEDGNYFTRVFRKIEGISPKNFRDNWTKLK